MKRLLRSPGRGSTSRSGNAFLEGALSFLPLMILTLGMVDMSMWLFVRGTIQSAAREAVRFAITYQTNYNGTSCGSQTNCAKTVLIQNALGFINASNINTYVSINYYCKDDLTTPLNAGNVGGLCDGIAMTAINQTGNLMEVRVNAFPWSFMFPTSYLPNSPLNISVSTSDVMQGLPVGQFVYPAP
jgi:Flp pilus assembly protein TadG